MKKIILILSVMSVLFLTGCGKDVKESNNTIENVNIYREEINDSGDVLLENDNSKVEENAYLKYSPLEYDILNDYDGFIERFFNLNGYEIMKDSTIDELQIIRNILFAVHGHDFKNDNLKEFFNKEYWYECIEGKEVLLSDLSAREQMALEIIDNRIALIRHVENEIPKYEYDPEKEIIYTFYEMEEDGYIKFKSPYINIDNENIYELNEELYNNLKEEILESYFGNSSVYYYHDINNNILSVIIMEEDDTVGVVRAYTYNIEIDTGKFVDKYEMLKRNGITEKDVLNMKEKIQNAKIKDRESTLRGYVESFYKWCHESPEIFAEQIAEEQALLENVTDIDKWEFVYFDDNQNLHIILEVPSAGADGATEAVDCVVEY